MNKLPLIETPRLYPRALVFIDDQLIDMASQQNYPAHRHSSASAPIGARPGDLRELLRKYADSAAALSASPPKAPLQRRFEVMAQMTPCAKAVSCNGHCLTYGELDAQADALALHLQVLGLRSGSFCLIELPPSLALIRAMLAVLKAGAACLRLDAAIGASATATAMELFRPSIRFAGSTAAHNHQQDAALKTIRCDEDAAELPYGWPDEPPINHCTPACAHALVDGDGTLHIHVRTHQSISAGLDGASGHAVSPASEPDAAALWGPLSRGALLTVAANT